MINIIFKKKYLLLFFVLVIGCNSNNEQLFEEISKEEFRKKAKELSSAMYEVYGESSLYSRDIFFNRNKNLIFLSLRKESNFEGILSKIRNNYLIIDSFFEVSRNYISHEFHFIDQEFIYYFKLIFPKRKSIIDSIISENNYLSYVSDIKFHYLLFKESIDNCINLQKTYIGNNSDTSKYSIAWYSKKRIKEIKEAQKEYIEKFCK